MIETSVYIKCLLLTFKVTHWQILFYQYRFCSYHFYGTKRKKNIRITRTYKQHFNKTYIFFCIHRRIIHRIKIHWDAARPDRTRIWTNFPIIQTSVWPANMDTIHGAFGKTLETWHLHCHIHHPKTITWMAAAVVWVVVASEAVAVSEVAVAAAKKASNHLRYY